ncbi:hypothetical protein [Myroides pelagicus]|uniref:Uncharacterized protein n=1 Tax=Myroides pelagicus TaxID=270914 RepID=A0A7K1GPQ8_9FLAO|nr:hypothetical protein [Myroides pelagicus]MEC4114667.1 hypothetical protein [Myroides pelagicus]MTH30831.1 hypothetical protein [Myroides pelagicus]
MKQGILIIVLLFFMKPIFPVLDFAINYDAIQELCINKDKPELACNGSCHLKTELAKTAQEDNPLTGKSFIKLQTEVLYFQTLQWEPLTVNQTDIDTQVLDCYNSLYAYLATVEDIKPPLV